MISAVVLSHNDQKQIKRTLDSITWCDEVIVVDDESTDGTVDMAKKHGATVYSHALQNDFASQRNFGLSKAKGEWVLFVDSDEVVSEELQNEIKKILNESESCDGYMIRRTDYMWGRTLEYGETAHVSLLRLAKKGSGGWERTVHEVWNCTGRIGTLLTPLLHFPHPTIAEFIRDVNKYSTSNAALLAGAKTPAPAWHIVAYPAAKFIRNYLWLQGYKDGVPGFCMAMIMSFHSFLTRAKLYMHYHARTVPIP